LNATFGSLFAGIGGIDLGLERAGWKCCWQVENNTYCLRILEKHWPQVRRYGNIKRVDPGELERVDLIAGGFPCQPTSYAGKRKGTEDPRWLWPEMARIIRGVRPRFVLVENPPGLYTKGFGQVLGDLAACRYDAEWDCLPAAAFGAPHLRYRIFLVAYSQISGLEGLESTRNLCTNGCVTQRRPSTDANSDSDGLPRSRLSAQPRQPHQTNVDPSGLRKELSDANESGCVQNIRRIFSGQPNITRSGWWDAEPAICRVVDGISFGVDRLEALGNAVVPQVAEWIGQRIIANLHGLSSEGEPVS